MRDVFWQPISFQKRVVSDFLTRTSHHCTWRLPGRIHGSTPRMLSRSHDQKGLSIMPCSPAGIPGLSELHLRRISNYIISTESCRNRDLTSKISPLFNLFLVRRLEPRRIRGEVAKDRKSGFSKSALERLLFMSSWSLAANLLMVGL